MILECEEIQIISNGRQVFIIYLYFILDYIASSQQSIKHL